MGSWDKTCGLSNLPIRCGESVYVVPLLKSWYLDRCHTTALYHPIPMLFESEYNDYGAGENNSGVGLNIIIDLLGPNIVIPNRNLDQFDVKMFFDEVHDENISVQYYGRTATPVDFAMIRQDVVQHIIDNRVIEHYVGENLGTSGYNNSYIEYKFSDIERDVDGLIQRVSEQFHSNNEDEISRRFLLLNGLNELFEYNDPNKATWYLMGTNHRFAYVKDIERLILKTIADGDSQHAKAILTDHLLFSYINSFMDSVRKVWLPGFHECSQSQEYQEYRLLNDSIDLVINDREGIYDEEE